MDSVAALRAADYPESEQLKFWVLTIVAGGLK
jgi:hypothetical protein